MFLKPFKSFQSPAEKNWLVCLEPVSGKKIFLKLKRKVYMNRELMKKY